MTRWHVQHGDVLDHPSDGLLCSANPNLNLSGGVGGAFALRYGDQMQTFLHDYLRNRSVRYVEPGTSVVAPACGSSFVAVAHAVSIDTFYDTDADTILRTYDAAIRGLASAGCSSVSAACLGCGYGRVTDDAFSGLSTRLFATDYPDICDVTLVTTNQGLAERLFEVLRSKTDG